MYNPSGILRRRYLTGLDWVIGTLDYGMKARTGAGNASELALLLEGTIDAEALLKGLADFLAAFPMINGRIKRDWLNLAPYWDYDHEGMGRAGLKREKLGHPVLDTQSGSGLSEEALNRAADFVNRPFKTELEHLGFALISGTDNAHLLLMSFDHRLMDARGAETFLALILNHLGGGEGEPRSIAAEVPSFHSAGLTGWKEKFLSGRDVNRRFLSISASSPAILPMPVEFRRDDSGVCPVSYAILSLAQEDTERAYALAEERAGFLMEMPYMLAATTRAFEAVLSARQTAGQISGQTSEECLVIPLTMDTREGRSQAGEMFFNYSSFMFFVLDRSGAGDMDEAIGAIKAQMYEQAKESFPRKLAQAAALMRIAPFRLIDSLIKRFLGAGASTLSFSYVGKAAIKHDTVLGARVLNMFHLPRVPTPPGLGVFFNSEGGRLNITVSFIEGVITRQEADALLIDIKKALL